MKKITMFVLETCPYCREAFRWMDEFCEVNPEFKEVEVEVIDENKHPEISDQYDYTYVPTFYVDGVKVHDGAATPEIIRTVFETAKN
jgi:glutaredoxin